MSPREEKLDTIISLLEEGNKLRKESLELAKQSFEKSGKVIDAQEEFQDRYKKLAMPLFKWVVPVTVVILVIIIFLIVLIVRLTSTYIW